MSIPLVFCGRPEDVPEWHRGCGEEQRPEKRARPVEDELPRVGEDGDQRGVSDAAPRVIRNRHRIGDHEKREEQQRSALKLMDPDGATLTEPQNPKRCSAEVKGKKRDAHVHPSRAVGDQNTERDEPSGEHEVVPPLRG